MRSTIYDVAARAQVSIATVSRVLNGRARVTPETRARVMEAVDALHYTPSPVARGLAMGATAVLALLYESFHGNYPSQLISGAEFEAASAGFALLAFQIQGREWDDLITLPGRADGVIVSGSPEHEAFLQTLKKGGKPTVILGHAREDLGMDGILPDNTSGTTAAIEHLIAHGRKRIAHIHGPETSMHAAERHQAYQDTLLRHGLPTHTEWIQGGKYSFVSGAQAMNALLDQEDRPDAVFAANDMMAMGAMQSIEKAGLNVPEDVAVVGFDGLDSGEYMTPSLTTVYQPIEEIGRAAVRMLVWRLKHPDAPVREEMLPTELIIRESCGVHAEDELGA